MKYFEWDLPDKAYSQDDSKKFYSEPYEVEYNKGSKSQYDLILVLGTETMRELGIVLDFKAKTIMIDEIILPMRDINHLQCASMLRALELNDSLSMELQSTQDATKRAMQILDAKYN